MRHPSILLTVVGLAIATPLIAQVTIPTTVYVSTGPGAGNQVLVLANADTTTPTPQVLCTGSAAFKPEDLVVGPDGFIYVANTTGGQIWRLDPNNLAATACDANTGGSELIYSGTLQPEGPTFVSEPTNTGSGSLDLLFNTRNGQGVWKLPGIASRPFGCGTTCATAVQVVTAPQSTSIGEGTKIGKIGDLLAVDNANGNLSKYSFPYTNSSTAFISGLSSPVGVATNSCGDILVATGKTVSRFDAKSGVLLDSLRFNGNNKPMFLEVDSSNHIYLVTASDESGSGGVVWRFDPPATNPLTSCSLKSFTQGYSIALKTTLGLASNNGLGVGVSASSATSPVQCFSPANPTQLYSFGTHSVTFTIDNMNSGSSVCLQITAVKSRPTDSSQPEVSFSSLPLPAFSCPAAPTSNTNSFPVPLPVCLHYASDAGFCTQYLEKAFTPAGVPLTDAQLNAGTYCSGYPGAPTQGACEFRGLFAYFTLDKFNYPGTAHVLTDVPGNPITLAYGSNPPNPTDDCQTLYFYPFSGGNGLDPTYTKGSNSKHVVFNSNLAFGPFQVVLGSPTNSCQTATGCNPQFNPSSNISVKFTFFNSTFNLATERLSIMRVQHTTKGQTVNEQVVENVVPTNNSSFQNFFDANGSGQYSYGVAASAFQPLPKGSVGIYQFTIWGNASAPFSFFVGVQF